jgi:hypothetical protein
MTRKFDFGELGDIELGECDSPYSSELCNLTKLKAVTARFYAGQYEQGYEWITNCSSDAAQKSREEFEAQGLEVFVGEKAFDVYGNPTSGKCILTRKRKQK